jgi:hypothetical protein
MELSFPHLMRALKQPDCVAAVTARLANVAKRGAHDRRMAENKNESVVRVSSSMRYARQGSIPLLHLGSPHEAESTSGVEREHTERTEYLLGAATHSLNDTQSMSRCPR